MAPPRVEGAAENLKLRLASALVLAPITILALVWSAASFAVLMGLAGLAMAWEWDRLRTGRFGLAGWIAAIGVVIAAGFALNGYVSVAVFVTCGGGIGLFRGSTD
jgi:hypothetical protein